MVSVLGAFKFDHAQPVKLILLQKFSDLQLFILGAGGSISDYPNPAHESGY